MRFWDELKTGDIKNAWDKGIAKPTEEFAQAVGIGAVGGSLNGQPLGGSTPPATAQGGQKGDAWAQYQYLRALDAQLGTPWTGSAPESREQLAQRRRGFRFGDFGNSDSSGM